MILFAAIFTNLSFLILDPLTILFRSLSTSIWPALDHLVTATETLLYPVPFLQEPLGWLESILRPTVFPFQPAFYRYAFLYALILGGIVALNTLAPRFWCRYLCPLGGLLGILSKFALVRREVNPECKQCALCVRPCPTGTINKERGYRSDPAECTVCMECIVDCPKGANSFVRAHSIAPNEPYNPNRRFVLGTFALTAGALVFARGDASTVRIHPKRIQPPGGIENDLLGKCVRCGECIRTCPTSAIQPAIVEAGLEGFWTPILVPRSGFCDYSCNACGQICPVQAIPPLSLEEKRLQVIGTAYIDTNRCIAWADQRPCIVCEEMCPLPEKAVWLEVRQVSGPDQQTIELQLPHVLRDRCIGCGICEYKCPVAGDAAIQIYAPGTPI